MGKKRRKRQGFHSQALDWLEWAALRTVVAGLHLPGERETVALGRGLGRLAYRVGFRRAVIRENLEIALGRELSASQLDSLALSNYQQWMLTFVEWARSWGSGLDGVLDRLILEGDQAVVERLAEGQGVLIVTAHFGHFELMPLGWAKRHGPLSLIVRPLDNRRMNQGLNRLRSRLGCQVLERKGIVRQALRCLRDGGMLGVLIDQNMVHREGIFVDFFGKPACTTPLPALLALRTGAAVFPCFLTREAPFRHRMIFGPQIPTVETGDLRADLETNTARYTQVVEDAIRARPDHWLWMHRRWRTQPAAGETEAVKVPARCGAERT